MIEVWPPEHAVLLVSFEVAGEPRGAGSKNAIPLGRWVTTNGQRRFKAVYREGGVPIVNVVDTAGPEGESWSADIRAACAGALDVSHEMHDGPIAVRVTFYGESPKGRYGTGRNAQRLKETAHRLPHRSDLPDGTKLARRLEDALNGLCWTDDRRVCEMWWSRAFGRHPGARVAIYGLPVRFCDLPNVDPALRAAGRPSVDQLVILDGDGGITDSSDDDSARWLARARAADRRVRSESADRDPAEQFQA